ncbi:hypothetical protein EDD75_0379 [Thermodesulfitimonas autotrophica]|uniref:Uncharacterized protein n=1 Tax=Thermodesulfitimonas autotrophica TaxID=1894989 RepID=A0A3N5BPL2_9THEO|nr:hypothetical protein [Thermodesulfitimonas autotrophica]RPF49562.1 hypothetical protein EDD75_0379 [Thermodesulfitimonas autotrophica]
MVFTRPDAVLVALNGACFLVSFPLYLYFRGCDRQGMYLAGGAVALCAAANGALLIASWL